MSNRILSLAVIMALAFTGLSAACHKDCGKEWKKHDKLTKKSKGTVDELKKRAQFYEAAYNSFIEKEAGKAAMESKNSLKECVANSSLSNKDIYKAVKNSLPKKKKAEGAEKHALKDVKQLIERICENREVQANGQSDATCVTQTAKAYFDSLIRVSKECPDAYARLKIAGFAYKTILKSLLKQGMKSEDLMKELEAAGITNSFILGKPAKMATAN